MIQAVLVWGYSGMAILWKKSKGEDLYEVRSAGASARLYCNGVNHS
ncbi:MAG: hypothetical protein ACQKBT_06395 [Puniceicoccales bacterium]